MKINNKGFTFVEILAVIVIIGLLTGISIAAFSRYKENAIKSDFEALARSSYNAMEEYMMNHPYETTATLDTLEKENLISNIKDPGAKDEDCTGTVEVTKNAGTNGKIDDGVYTVNLCCVSDQKTYTYPEGKSKKLTDRSKCNYVPEEEPTPPPTPPTPTTQYTLKYNDNGGSGCSTKTIKKNKNVAWGTLCTPTRTGYTFNGWKSGSTTITSASKATANITVTAQWTTNKYTLTFNKDGGSGTCNSITKNYNTTWGSLCTPTKTGYTFGGWYTVKNGGGTKITSSSKATKNITVYAKWTTNKYTLTFNKDGGSGTCNSITKNYNTTWGSLCSPTKTGYLFDGWYTSKNGGGTKITSTSKATKNLTVYAKWRDKCATITYRNGTTCNKKCGGGTYNRLAYSTIDNTRCPGKDLSSGGSACNTTACSVRCTISYNGTVGDYGWYKGYGKITLNITTNGTISSKGLKKQTTKLTSGNNVTQITINADQTKTMYQGYVKINELSTPATCNREIGVDTKPPYIYAINHKCNINVRISARNHYFRDVYFICITDNYGVGSGVHGGGGSYTWNGGTYSYGVPDYNAEDYCAPHMQGYINGSVYTGVTTRYSFYTSDFAGNKSDPFTGTLRHNC